MRRPRFSEEFIVQAVLFAMNLTFIAVALMAIWIEGRSSTATLLGFLAGTGFWHITYRLLSGKWF